MSADKQAAFMQAYKGCHEPFVRYCSAVAYGKMDTDDLVQDVLLSAFHHFDGIEKKDELLHYLLRAARNRAISVWRMRRKNEAICEKQAKKLMARGASAEMMVDVGILYGALDKLPGDQREALVLFEVSGLSMAEIAVIQDRSEGSVKTCVSRARTALRQQLQGRVKSAHAEVLHTLTSFLL
ncbi:MAG TPA: RNA polymerase sigma factor [Flavobacteriales bacterium]|nr:RNA polymerase sigma factor [Flavobacteriales bacterium]